MAEGRSTATDSSTDPRSYWAQRTSGLPRNYDTEPSILVPDDLTLFTSDGLISQVEALLAERQGSVVAFDTYPGTDLADLAEFVRASWPAATVIDLAGENALPGDELEQLLQPYLTEDRVFGVMNELELREFYRPGALDAVTESLRVADEPTVVIGWGAALVAPSSAVRVLVDMARWEIQLRQRAGQTNWMADNADEDQLRKYKRSFFVEWRVADRHKVSHIGAFDFLCDGNRPLGDTVATSVPDFRRMLHAATRRPFRVKPFFDPGVWGGYWMENLFDLPPRDKPYAWCFDCVPEENSLQFSDIDGKVLEVPALDLVLLEGDSLLGHHVIDRFGREFPIRFDFLDTMGGQNLSLQVHPLRAYIGEQFGMSYTQDESYYLLDAEPGAVAYLGLREDADPEEFTAGLRQARDTGEFDAERFVNVIPANPHDHLLIPAGTIHCSGANTMVLEISATPFIFTFKLWDWGRLGLDGKPRPIHLDHGLANIQWERRAGWVDRELVNHVEVVRDEPGHVEEITGLHEKEFIETRRHWFSEPVDIPTRDTVNVLNLVSGEAAIISSPTDAFEPFEVHYAETFIVPAAIDTYRVTPRGRPTSTDRHGVIVARVREGREPVRGEQTA